MKKSPFLSLPKSACFTNNQINSFILKKSFGNFIFDISSKESLKITKSLFLNTLDTVVLSSEIIVYNQTFTNDYSFSDIITDIISIKECHFINCSCQHGVISIGQRSNRTQSFILSNSVFQHCFIKEFGCVKAYLSKISLENNCFFNISTELMATAAYIVLNANEEIQNIIHDTTFLFSSNDAVSENPILSFIAGSITLQRINMSYCSGQSPAFVQSRRTHVSIHVSTFTNSQSGVCFQFVGLNSAIEMSDGVLSNVSLAFEMVVLSTYDNFRPKLTMKNYILNIAPGSNRAFPKSKDCTITIVQCYSEYQLELYFMKDIELIIYNGPQTKPISSNSWKFPALDECVLHGGNQENVIKNENVDYIPYIVLTCCLTVLIVFFLLTMYVIIKTRPISDVSSMTLTSSIDDF